MAKYGKKASEKVERAMHERKRGTLKSGRSGKRVTSRKQAIAIGLSEAREAGGKVPARGRSKKKSSSKSSSASRKKYERERSRNYAAVRCMAVATRVFHMTPHRIAAPSGLANCRSAPDAASARKRARPR